MSLFKAELMKLSLLGAEPINTPKILYHYTTQRGFVGIVNSKSIWATNITYLNDSTEFTYAFDVAKRIINYLDKAHYKYAKDLIKLVDDVRLRNIHANHFVCSFTEKGDLLSQWRGYCPDGNGYSLGFSFENLRKLSEKQGFEIIKCVYDYHVQHRLVYPIIIKTLDNYEHIILGSKYEDDKVFLLQDFQYTFQNSLLEIASFLKHPAYKEEKEWRLIKKLEDESFLKFREGASMLVPHIDLMLTDGNEKLFLEDLYIGPTLHPELSKISAAGFLLKNNSDYKSLKYSNVPHRFI